MKRITAALILLLCMLFTTAEAALILEYDGAVRNYTGSIYELEVNGKRLTDLPLEPIIFNDRALVPVREIFEAMGATVDYEPKDKSVTVTHGKKSVFLKINSFKAKVNNVSTSIPDGVTPKLIAKWGEDAKTMVPVRFISENIGMIVNFSQEEGLISITDPDYLPPADNRLKKISYNEDDDIVEIRITAENEIESMTKPALTESGVLYTDIANMSYDIQNRTQIELGAVLAVRLGTHEQSTRIAIDTDGMKKYSVSLSTDKKTIILKISQSSDAELDDTTELPTESPSPTTKPTQKPNRPAANPGELIVVLDAGHGGSDPGVVRNRFTDDEIEEWLSIKESSTPSPSSSPSPTPSATPSAKPDSKKQTASPSPAPTASPSAITDGGTGKMYKEKDIALSVAQKTKKLLENKGIKVIMTRDGDTYPSLDERPELAISKGASLFLSIHVNSTNDTVTKANGIEVYYSTQNNGDSYTITSEEFAEEILDNVISSTKAKERGVKSANYLVIRKCTMPAALIEMGFMNNPDEFELLITDEYQQKIANGISKGIIKSLSRVEIKPEPEETEEPEIEKEAGTKVKELEDE